MKFLISISVLLIPFIFGIVIGATSDLKNDSDIDYEDKYSRLESEMSEAKSCIEGLKAIIDESKYNMSSAQLTLSTRDDEYETLYGAIQEARDSLQSSEDSLSGIPGDCFPRFLGV